MRALYLFLDRTTGVGRPRHTADESLTPIRTGAFTAWMASAPASQRPRLQRDPRWPGRSGHRAGRRAQQGARRHRGRSRRGTPPRRTRSSRSAERRRASSATCTASGHRTARRRAGHRRRPTPRCPGSHAATTASASDQSRSSITGRPERMTTTSRSTSGRTAATIVDVRLGQAQGRRIALPLGVGRLGDDDDPGPGVRAGRERPGRIDREAIAQPGRQRVGDRRARA